LMLMDETDIESEPMEEIEEIEEPAVETTQAEEEKPKDIFDILIPNSWGSVKEVYKGTSEQVIVHIQDAHCNYEAQTNIANILDLLVTEYGLTVAGVEGSVGRLQTELFSTFPEDAIREQAADYFVREGKMSGMEALAIAKGFEYPLALYGIENNELYENNFNAFQASLPFKEEAKGYFRYLNKCLAQLKTPLYTPEISDIDLKQISFNINILDLNTYALYLAQLLEKRQLDISKYPNFAKLIKAINIEEKIDFIKAEEERTKLLTELTNVLSEEDVRKLLDKGLAFRDEKLSASRYLGFIKELAKANEVDFVQYINLDNYIEYAQSYDEIKSFELFNEMEEVDLVLRSKLYANEIQKKLDFLMRGLRVMERMVDIKMVNKDLAFYNEHKEELKTDKYIAFINEQAEKYGIKIDLPDISYLDVYMPAWADFYRVAGLRDEAMISNTLQAIAGSGSKIGAMVTGGFHTRELTRMMLERNLSYIVITPRITKNIPGPYFDRLTGKKSPLDLFMEEMNAVVPVKEAVEENAQKIN
ncbi:MAG: hypothetical protein KKF93_02495, partial [Candidatus Omnitrophica bacterium]|nr:hypothetical protein [Candidatus Omnitrophota bacterium]